MFRSKAHLKEYLDNVSTSKEEIKENELELKKEKVKKTRKGVNKNENK